jgi:hypothetical protein
LPDDGGPECDTCHGYRLVREEVPVDHPLFGKAIPCESDACRAWRHRRANERLMQRLPNEWADWSLDGFSAWIDGQFPDAAPKYRALLEWLGEWLTLPHDGDCWLYMFSRGENGLAGGSGRGKTSIAFSLLKLFMDDGESAAFEIVADFLDRLRNSYRNGDTFGESGEPELQHLMDVDVLVLDDIGAERVTPSGWVQDVLFRLIAHRHMHHKRTIFTSNLGLDDLAEHLNHPRTPSRIKERCGRGLWVIDMSKLPDIREAPRTPAF